MSELLHESGRFRIRTMTRPEIDLAVEWAAREGWNPGLHDAECFYAADPEGFLIGELDGEPVGCISAVRYGDEFGFIGFYIMRPEFRAHGNYGYALGNAAAKRLEGVNAGLDGVVRQQPHYVKLWGCALAHRNVRYELAAGTAVRPQPETGLKMVPLTELPFEMLANYDRQVLSFERDAFLQCWITRQGTVAIGAMNDGALVGYGVIRPCRNGYKLAPLFADTADVSAALFSQLARHAADGPVYLDIPQVNQAALSLVERHQMTPVFETARMYTKRNPNLPLHRIYGITSFELG